MALTRGPIIRGRHCGRPRIITDGNTKRVTIPSSPPPSSSIHCETLTMIDSNIREDFSWKGGEERREKERFWQGREKREFHLEERGKVSISFVVNKLNERRK